MRITCWPVSSTGLKSPHSIGHYPGYDEATNLLIELREVARHFDEFAPFEERFQTWVAPHLRRPAFVKRLRTQRFAIPSE